MIGLGMGVGLLILGLISGGVVLLGMWLVKAITPAGHGPAGNTPDRELTPLEILDRRYARGEITQDQHKRMKADLVG